jgi:hypothetical protein
VRLTRNPDPGGPAWGSVTFAGPFAFVDSYGSSVILERCGTHMRRRLGGGESAASSALASSATAVVWQAVTGRLTGVLLPSLQAFTIPLPRAIGLVGSLGLTSRALYVSGYAAGVVWRTASPAALPVNTTRPTLTRSRNTLRCRRGTWRGAIRFAYTWQVNGIPNADTKASLVLGRSRTQRRVTCSVTAANATGTTTASSAQLPLRPTATTR